MKKEFMLYIRNAEDARAALSGDQHLALIKQCEVYIKKLKAGDSLIAAQPIAREGIVVTKNSDGW
ncbi:MAG TPA: hypothetical protein VGI82_01805 [Chitinophagaceae bacterium]|jgi:predicted nucleic acid-binding protein